MNIWVKKSIEIAREGPYLDGLLNIYPPEAISRDLTVEEFEKMEESPTLRELFNRKDCKALIKKLLQLKREGFKFPVENPYVSFLSHYEEAIEKNPKTIEKICDEILGMGYNNVKKELEAPKRASRRMGPMFRKWLTSRFKFDKMEGFEETTELTFLEGSDTALRNFALIRLQWRIGNLSKGLDFIAKTGGTYIIGTAKFITDFGGAQFNQFREAIELIKKTKHPKNIIPVAVLDGVIWLAGENTRIYRTLKSLKNSEFCLSALLFPEFLGDFLK